MEKPIVLIGIPGSSLADEVAASLERTAFPYYTRSLDAPLAGGPVTFAPGSVIWEGVDLLDAGAIFVERPVFPWPQARPPAERSHTDFTNEQWIVFQREASSLIVSAILAAADVRPVVNPPAAAAHLAISPSIALDRLAIEGIPVHPWSLEPAPPRDRSGAGFVLDACGRDRWHTPERPRTGEPSLVLEAFAGEVVTFIVVGGMSVGALRYDSGGLWAKWHEAEGIGGEVPEPVPEAADLASRAAAALKLDYAAVSICTGTSPLSVLLCEAGPDLAAWNGILGGRLAHALADHLASVASK
ncbi:MAG TPA: hypothetical protein VMX58_00075 [Patescibacteria group bacterium]|nr:hypothetical protein [Patescibacteria group bacterium]